ncbi:hypothetical protein Mucpa_0024 [Mucilaginibacter paludis DSM 18603]|uniref:Uncharacterized protein n=1 Tax=Mucilaginibacter paludis DSM 18603 TaxID=714943 RepID=H1YCP1_9SPHI|nr:hypothetical protein Mucpa_0024 [Mucilaginibacter paludis DSM 18603]
MSCNKLNLNTIGIYLISNQLEKCYCNKNTTQKLKKWTNNQVGWLVVQSLYYQ